MMLLCLIILVCYILIKLILYFSVRKYEKFFFDGFSSMGFIYDSEKDIFYSSKNAWQKNLGYTHMYDVLAPLFRMIFDTEPIRFYYNNKNWLITFCDQQMLEAFLESFKQLGYTSSDFKIIDNTFCFRYIKPHTRKVWTRCWLVDSIRQFLNHKNVELYNKYLIGLIDNNKIDDSKINARKRGIIINEFFPKILKNIPENKIYLGKNVKKILVEKEKNIIFLKSNVYSGIEGRKHE